MNHILAIPSIFSFDRLWICVLTFKRLCPCIENTFISTFCRLIPEDRLGVHVIGAAQAQSLRRENMINVWELARNSKQQLTNIIHEEAELAIGIQKMIPDATQAFLQLSDTYNNGHDKAFILSNTGNNSFQQEYGGDDLLSIGFNSLFESYGFPIFLQVATTQPQNTMTASFSIMDQSVPRPLGAQLVARFRSLLLQVGQKGLESVALGEE
jgi:hypothetical protein